MNFNFKKLLPQTLTLLVVILVFGFFTYNAQVNMENRGIDFGYSFLTSESSFDVQFSLIEYDGSHSYFRAYLVGLLNTILVSVVGIIIATVIGIIVGIARLSPNYLIEKTAAFYVEFFRNIPLLLQLFFWYFAALRILPLPEKAEPMFGVFFLTIKGFFVPAFVWNNLDILIYSIIAATISIIFVRIYAKKKQENEGAAIAVLISELVMAISLRFLCYSYLEMRPQVSFFVQIFFAIIVGLIMWQIQLNLDIDRWYELFFFSALGGLLYISFLATVGAFTLKDFYFFWNTMNPKAMTNYVTEELKRK